MYEPIIIFDRLLTLAISVEHNFKFTDYNFIDDQQWNTNLWCIHCNMSNITTMSYEQLMFYLFIVVIYYTFPTCWVAYSK